MGAAQGTRARRCRGAAPALAAPALVALLLAVASAADDSSIAYRRAQEMLSAVVEAGGGLVDVSLQLTGADGRPVPGLQMWITAGRRVVPVPLGDDGQFTLPPLPPDEADTALLHRNVAARLQLGVDFQPHVAGSGITVRQAVQIIDAGNRALGASVPWYLRALAPGIRGLGICLASRDAALAERARLLPAGPALPIVAEKARDTDTAPRHCLALNATSALPPDRELRPVSAAGYQFLTTAF